MKMTNKLERLTASLEKAEQKVEKINNTIEKYFKQLEKKIAAVEKLGFEIDYSEVNFNVQYGHHFTQEIKHIDNLKWGTDGKSVAAYWELCEVVRKLEDIYGSYKKLAETETIVSNWGNKVTKEKTITDVMENTPQVLIDFIENWAEKATEWMLKNTKFSKENIEKMIAADKEIKLYQLKMRVEAEVGEITNAKYLSVSGKGDLTGVIEGKQGKAHVHSIMAGGWNIQRFHYRTLVTPM